MPLHKPALVVAALLAFAAPAGGQSVDRQRLMADVAALADDAMTGRGTGTEGAAKARRYIARRFAEHGLSVQEHRFAFTSRDGRAREGINLIARVPGTGNRRGIIVVTAHYDHDGIKEGRVYNGADDNASGVAALLALAAALKRAPPGHEMLLVALDAEEPGLFGARAFVAEPPVPLGQILLNINLDMVSRPTDGVLWAVGGGRNPALRPVLEQVAARAPIRLRLGHDGQDGQEDWTMSSDHGPFHRAGIPFVYFGVDNHADYHKPTDDSARIDPDIFGRCADTILAAIRAFDAAPAALSAANRAR